MKTMEVEVPYPTEFGKNFRCECGEEYHLSKFGWIGPYHINNGNTVKCSKCRNTIKIIIKEV